LEGRSSFRFLERWRIGFSWLSGAVGAHDCRFGANPFAGKSEYGALGQDINAPHWKWRNAILGPGVGDPKAFPGRTQIMVRHEVEDPADPFTVGYEENDGRMHYTSYCSASLDDSWTSASATIINSKMYRDLGALTDGAQSVRVGENKWRFVQNPISDYVGNDYGGRPLLETWVLEIPDTDYWMVFKFYASKQMSYVDRHEEYERVHDLFRQSIASVSLVPIEPLVDQEKIISPKQCVRRHSQSPWFCLFNESSLLKR
jgi:hypothetical protein